jgi:sulfur transfer complex TusBCD TusB component (DsrH family)
MSDVELQDALNEMKDRCFGLEAASAYFTDDDIMARGLTRLVADLANQMAEIARA